MTPLRSFRINQYNWLGQKFLAQHRYDDILKLRENLTHQKVDESDVYIGDRPAFSRPLSDHLSYVTGLALMKTSNYLEELILNLQRLSFQKNSQYFLLLCQCLLYLGNHDSVVAICKQALSREISAVPMGNPNVDDTVKESNSDQDESADPDEQKSPTCNDTSQPPWCLDQISEESLEFRKIFESVSKNCPINDPKLWFVFALSLEHQLQFKDADLAHRVACKLASGQAKQVFSRRQFANDRHRPIGTNVYGSSDDGDGDNADDDNGTLLSGAYTKGISNYYLPHTKYSEFCVRYRADYKTAMQILAQVSQIAPPINYTLNPNLALTLCSQASSNSGHFKKALEMITSLDNHTNSLRNPSFNYNQLALKCKQKWYYYHNGVNNGNGPQHLGSRDHYYLRRVCDENQTDLEYNLIKSHILINSVVQSAMHNPMLYKWSQSKSATTNEVEQIFIQIDRLIESLRNCDTSCWSSHSLWNNLGVCYLMKRRYVASLSCLMKAQQLNPLDWRINYNLSLVHLHVGTTVRALCCSLASRNNHLGGQKLTAGGLSNYINHRATRDQMIDSMVAMSYSGLGLTYEARRFYAELVAQLKGGKLSVLTMINYLLLLYQGSCAIEQNSDGISCEQDVKSCFRLLDLLEQAWLQRSPNDAQFSSVPLGVALQIGEAIQQVRPLMKKNYAWTKHNH